MSSPCRWRAGPPSIGERPCRAAGAKYRGRAGRSTTSPRSSTGSPRAGASSSRCASGCGAREAPSHERAINSIIAKPRITSRRCPASIRSPRTRSISSSYSRSGTPASWASRIPSTMRRPSSPTSWSRPGRTSPQAATRTGPGTRRGTATWWQRPLLLREHPGIVDGFRGAVRGPAPLRLWDDILLYEGAAAP